MSPVNWTNRGDRPAEAPTKKGQKPIALVVDDDSVSCIAMEFALKKFGIEPIITSNSKDFLEFARSTEASLFFIDLNLNDGTNGFELIEFLFKQFGKLIPIIVVSGSKDFSDVLYALEMGAHDFISKPLDKEILASKLARYIKNQQIELTPIPYTKLPNGPSDCKMYLNCKIESIDENGLKLTSPHLITNSALLELEGSLIEEIALRKTPIPVQVSSIWVSSDRSSFGAYAQFDTRDLPLLQAVRKWLITKNSLPPTTPAEIKNEGTSDARNTV